MCGERSSNGSIEEANRLGDERIEARDGARRRSEQGRGGSTIAGQREPELTVEICAADHRQAIEIARLSFERGGVVVRVRLAEAILSDAMGVGDRDDSPVEKAEVRLQIGREPHGLRTESGDLSQQAERDLTLRHVVQSAERHDGLYRCGSRRAGLRRLSRRAARRDTDRDERCEGADCPNEPAHHVASRAAT
ncbi:MAG TPA: hypothetical protein VN903_30265 [Polyangia bacterium]|nr:hypothetical protein [Polyangia bacterium]